MHRWMREQQHHAVIVAQVIWHTAGSTSCDQMPLVSILHVCLASLLR